MKNHIQLPLPVLSRLSVFLYFRQFVCVCFYNDFYNDCNGSFSGNILPKINSGECNFGQN